MSHGLMHEHKFVYGGNVYTSSERPMAGTGAHSTQYYQEYFCEMCLEKKHRVIRASGNTYEQPKFNAVPISRKEIKE